MAYYTYDPACSLTMSRIDLKADINNKAHGFFWEATSVAGPDPIDLPNKMIELSSTPKTIFK